MNNKLMTSVASLAITLLLVSIYQPSNGAIYSEHDGTVDEYMTKKVIKPYDKSNLRVYMVQICSIDRTMVVSSVTPKSDIDEKHLTALRQFDKANVLLQAQ